MGKEETEKEGEDMQVTLERTESTFSKFLQKNRSKIRQIAEANTTKNKDGVTVLAKDDPWRTENEWDEIYKKP